jgi:hypothetical protein
MDEEVDLLKLSEQFGQMLPTRPSDVGPAVVEFRRYSRPNERVQFRRSHGWKVDAPEVAASVPL